MRKAGGWVLTLGLIGAAYALFLFDPSVSDGQGGRVNNIGLMADRQNYLIAAALAVIVGVILMVSDKSPRIPRPSKAKVELPFGIEEEEGLFAWGGETFATAEEAITHVQQRLADHKAKAATR